MCINTSSDEPIILNGCPLEVVEEFNYLGSLLSKDNAETKDTKEEIGKGLSAFARLQSIWKSAQYSLWTKMRLYNRNVKSVLHVLEYWTDIKSNMKKIVVLHNNCLNRILLAKEDFKYWLT